MATRAKSKAKEPALVEVPKLVTLTQAALVRETLEAMEDDLRITPKQARDFIESMSAVVEEHLEAGERISLAGLVTITPSFSPSLPKRKGRDPRTGEETMLDSRPARVRVRVSASSRVKNALPGATTKAGKHLKSIADARKANSEARKAASA